MPSPQRSETGLRRLADGDRSCSTAWHAATPATGHPRARPSRPRVVLVPGASADVDRPGGPRRRPARPAARHRLGARRVGVDLRSAHVATHAGQAVDVLYVAEPGGVPLAPARVAATVAALVDAGALPEDAPRAGPAPRLGSLLVEARADLLQRAPERALLRRPGTLPALVRPALVYLDGQVVVLAVVWVSANLAGRRLWDVLHPGTRASCSPCPSWATPTASSGGPELVRVLPRVPAGGPLDVGPVGPPAGGRRCPRLTRVRDRLGLCRRRLCGGCARSGRTGPRARGAAGRDAAAVGGVPHALHRGDVLRPGPVGPGLRGAGRWLAAGVLAACAGLVRPTAAAVVLAVWVGAALAWRRGRFGGRRALAAAAVAPLGTFAYLVYVALATTGGLTAWSESERKGWDSRFDYGRFTWTWLRALFQFGGGPMDGFIVAGAGVRGAHRGVAAAGAPRAARRGVRARRDRDRPRDERHVGEQVPVPAAGAGRDRSPRGGRDDTVAVVEQDRRPAPVGAAGAWFSGYALVGYHFAI